MTDTTTSYAGMTGQDRGVEAIKHAHRGVRQAIKDAGHFPSTADHANAMGRLTAYLDMLAILRPEMSRGRILEAAIKRLDEDG